MVTPQIPCLWGFKGYCYQVTTVTVRQPYIYIEIYFSINLNN
nr:MAG TPA: hypothetical protein [Caudoviricetes sp.]